MKEFRRRVLVTLTVLVALVAIAVSVVVALPRGENRLITLVPPAVLAVVLLILVAVNLPALRNEVALRRLVRAHPDALVFLAWRQPTLAPDLPTFLRRKNLVVQVKDTWTPAVVDDRGISAWTSGPRPKQLLLMEWSELGEIVASDFTDVQGRTRFGIAVDVRPFPTPLIVLVGYAWLGVQGGFDRSETVGVADATNSMRPVLP